MFEKNDKILFIMRFAINVLSVVAGIACIILGIVLAAKGVSNGYIILFGGVESGFSGWSGNCVSVIFAISN